MDVVTCSGLNKKFYYYQHQPRSLRDIFITLLHPKKKLRALEEWYALRSIDLTVARGETIAFVGHNGSGKSTLLKIIAGIYRATSGRVEVQGKVAPLLELGVGFHPDLTGKENVYLYASILGLRKREVDRLYGQMVEFADLEKFMGTPVKYYSSGMYARLGFSVAVFVNPDILLIDEVLSVGDVSFRSRCDEKIKEFQNRGKTILLVSHDLDTVAKTCTRAAWLAGGRMAMVGNVAEVIKGYQAGVTVAEDVPSI
ncbi:MAG: ABC transporter ATP-binding protein [Acidobacteria bacterium]|nr:ABC transporter ATP-binding protein [Acidobacteriota bacterium]